MYVMYDHLHRVNLPTMRVLSSEIRAPNLRYSASFGTSGPA